MQIVKENMKLLLLLYSIILLIGQQACKKPAPIMEPIPNQPINKYYSDTIVPIVWESIKDENNNYLDANSIEYKDSKVYTVANYKLANYNAQNGAILNLDIIPGIGNIKTFAITTQNTVVARGQNDNGIYAYPSFNLIRQYPNVSDFKSCNSYYYDKPNVTYRFYSDNNDSSALVSKIINGQEKVIFKDSTLWKNNYVAALPTYFWTKPNGDSCLVLSPALLERQGGNANHTAVCIYNLFTKQVEWSLIDFDYSGLGGALAIKDNKFYCNGPRHLYCYDLITHQKLWEYDFRNDDPAFGGFSYYDNTPLFFDNDKMYIHSSGKMAYCFNRNTGQTIWKVAAGNGPGNKQEYNGIIYFRGSQFDDKTGGSSANIVGIRKTDGKVVYSARSPEAIRSNGMSGTAWFCNNIALDASKGWLFALTPNQMVCLDISKIQ